MRKKSVKFFGIILVVSVLGAVMASCKASHEVCPAYTKVENKTISQY